MPETPISIAHLPLARLSDVEDTDAQADVMQDPVRILFVEDVDDGLLCGQREGCWLYGDRVLQRF